MEEQPEGKVTQNVSSVSCGIIAHAAKYVTCTPVQQVMQQQ